MKNSYQPKPIDASDVELPEELMTLVEELARNVHDMWAQARLDEGWRYGAERNEERMEHPCLVDYDELPELEREYDRNTALGTLKLVYKLGFKIVKE